MAGELYVSRRTISNDLRLAKDAIGRYNLSVEEKPHHGVRVVGPEIAKRLCLAAFASREQESSLGDRVSFSHALSVISEAIDAGTEHSYTLSSVTRHNLVVHLMIAVLRIQQGCYVPMDPKRVAEIEHAHIYNAARAIAQSIETAFDIDMPDAEIAYIAIHLEGKQSTEDSAGKEDGFAISDEIWSITAEMIDVVQRTFNQDFHGDLELRMNLARHLMPLSVRLQYNLSYPNPMLDDIKKRYPMAYAMAQECATVLASRYERTLDEGEIGYIALAFALALERRRGQLPRKNILVVCASGAGTAKLLEQQYRSEFGPLLGEVYTCDVSRFKSFDLTRIDYIFSTVPLPVVPPIPVRNVRAFLDGSDIHQIRSALSQTPCVEHGTSSAFSQKLFFSHRCFADKHEALDFICSEIQEQADVPADFRTLVQEREDLAPTCFSEGIALPHPIRPVSRETFVCTCVLDRPILWNGYNVSVVMLLSVAAGQPERLGSFYQALINLVLDQDFIQQLIADQRLEVVLQALTERKA